MGRELPHVRACARVRGCAAEYARAEVRVGGRLRSTAAVAAKRRLPCAARPAVASQNSLRSLRSLRSNSRDESDDEARASARRPRVCAARRRSRRCACRPPEPLRERHWTPGHVHRWFFAKPWAGGRSCFAAAVGAPRRLSCGARCSGASAELALAWPASRCASCLCSVLGQAALVVSPCGDPMPRPLLRSSAPQRRTPGHPPTALRRTSGASEEESTAVHAEMRVGGRRSACCGAEQRRPGVGARTGSKHRRGAADATRGPRQSLRLSVRTAGRQLYNPR